MPVIHHATLGWGVYDDPGSGERDHLPSGLLGNIASKQITLFPSKRSRRKRSHRPPPALGCLGGLWGEAEQPPGGAGRGADLGFAVCELQVSSPSPETEAVTAVPAPPGLQAAVPAPPLCPPHQPGSPRRWQWFVPPRNLRPLPRPASRRPPRPCPT